MSKPVLFTVGHSTHTLEVLVASLRYHGVTALADVRSHPYSRRLPQFNRETLTSELQDQGIRYVFLGEELGARRVEPECYEGRRVVFERIAKLPKFRAGLERLRRGALEHRIALMCAEKEPLDCHRTILICRELRNEFNLFHILSDGSIEEHVHAEQRLVRAMDVTRTLFEPALTVEQLIHRAYDKRAEQIAYHASLEGALP